MVKTLLVAASCFLILGCTSTYNIKYSVTTTDSSGITVEDIEKINVSLPQEKSIDPAYEPNALPNTFYLSRHLDAWEILNVENDDSNLFFSVTRLTKRLGSFSDNWKNFFKSKMESIIEKAINKPVDLQEVVD